MSSSIERLTLREKLHHSHQTVRKLAEHLEQAFVPRVHDLRKVCRHYESSAGPPAVSDVTIRSYVSLVLESDRFTVGLNETLERYLTLIQKDVSAAVSRESNR